jgi:hypothetical protein
VLSRTDPPSYYIALAYVGLGDNDNAFRWLDKTLEERAGPFNELNADPMFDPLRADPRFPTLLRRMGLPDSRRGEGISKEGAKNPTSLHPFEIADHHPKFAGPARFPRWIDSEGNPEIRPV